MGDIMGAFNEAVGLTEDPAEVQRQAAEWQREASREANALQREQWQTTLANQAPWLQAGTAAVNRLAGEVAPGGQLSTVPWFDPKSVNLTADPGYKFRLQTGADAITAAGSAMGNLGSGNLGVALTQYGQNLGSQEYGAAYGRAMDEYNAALQGQNTIYNRLAGVAGTGQIAANQLASTGANVAANMGANLIAGAQGYGANMVGAAGYNAASGRAAGAQMGSIANQLANYYAQQNAMNNARGYNYLGDAYNASYYSDGGGGVYGGAYEGQDLYAGDLWA